MKKLFILLFTLFMFVACGESSDGAGETSEATQENYYEPPQKNSSKENYPQETSPTQTTKIVIQKANGQKISTIKLASDKIKIQTNNGELKAKPDFSGKYKYKDESGDTQVKIKKETKKGEPRIRLFKGDRLLWKVKIDKEGKIKIADNEENENPYFIKLDKENKAKIKYNDKKIGFAKYKDGKIIITNTNNQKLYEVKTNDFNIAYAILAAEDIPMKYRLIILSELLNR